MKQLLLAAGLIFLTVRTAEAGGWAIVTLDSLLEGVAVGEEQTVGFMVLQHGVRPAAGSDARVVLVHRESGDRVSALAVDEGAAGHYAARFTLPRAGWWDWKIQTWGRDHIMPPVHVAHAPSAATMSQGGRPIYREQPGDLVYYGPTPLPSESSVPWPAMSAFVLFALAFRILRKRDGVTMTTPSNSCSARRARSLVTT